MIFENVFIISALKVLLSTFIVGFVGILLGNIIIWKKNPFLSQYNNFAKIVYSALVGGVATSFLLSIAICTLTPSLITIGNDLSYKEELSFYNDEEFIGIGGSYIANKSFRTLRLVGIDGDNDINVRIKSGCIEKIRKCPESYFQEIPEHQTIYYIKRRGKRKAISGSSVFLIAE